MPLDHYEDDDDDSGQPSGKGKKDFDCPTCNANNPRDEPISDGEELLCNYCGSTFEVKMLEEGQFKLRET